MSIRHAIFLFLILSCPTKSLQAQNFQWLKGYGSTNSPEYNSGICAEADGGCTLLITRNGQSISSQDTITFDSILFLTPTTFEKSVYLVRLDIAGKVLKATNIGNFIPAHGDFSYYSAGNSLYKDSSGNYYLGGYLSILKPVKVGNDTLLGANGGTLMFAKFDKNFNLIWATQNGGNEKLRHLGVNYSNGHFYFRCNPDKGSIKIGNTTYNLAQFHSSLFGEVNTNTGSIKWSNYFGNNGNLSISNLLYLNGAIYLSAFNPSFGYKIGLDSFPKWGGFVIQTDTYGNYIKRFEFHNQNPIEVSCIATDGQYLYIGGQFKDTLNWGSRIILPEYKTSTSGIPATELYAASLTPSFKPRWFFHPKIVDKTRPSGLIFTTTVSDNFIYYGGWLTSKILIDSNTLAPGSVGAGDALIFKADQAGNILWAVNGRVTSEAEMTVLTAGKGVFGGGVYRLGPLQLGKHIIQSKGNYYDAFVTKISDNAIIRGKVKSGPYCAGDSIKIPYIKIGLYDTSNSFIAQLSNEFGNFDSAYHELGRIKSNKDGTITGKLPLFRVASSQLYRIRILSTKPAVQSYYKADTLRLLIYSRDKANPGKDVTICKGDTTTLKTYGGTKWNWSPGYKMTDSTAHQTRAWPDKTTRYKITIADSSGCGQADTAYKTVFVRKPLKVLFPGSDTTVCKNATVHVVVKFKGGDSLNYTWQWYGIDKNGGYTELQTGKKKLSDTLKLTIPATEKDSQRLVVFLEDGCSHQTGFSFFTIFLSKVKPDAVMASKDTAVCPGSATPFIANFSMGYEPGYNWKWIEKNANGNWQTIVSGSKKVADTLLYTMPANWNKNKKKVLAVVLNDACSPFADTALLNISLRDTLQVTLRTQDTTLCKGTTYTWKAKGLGGNTPDYQFTWTDMATGKVLAMADSLSIIADSTMKVNVKLTDNCMPKSISTSFTIIVHPPLKAAAFGMDGKPAGDTVLCFGQTLKLFAKGSGGKGNGYGFKWELNKQSITSSDTLAFNTQNYFPKTGGIQMLVLEAGDNCTVPSDTTKILVTVLPGIDVTASVPDSACYNTKAVFKAKASGGKGNYQYKWLDANNALQGNADSLIVNNNNLLQTGTVKRIVTVTDGCSLPDTTIAVSEFLKPLTIKLSASDTCPTAAVLLTVNAQGGKGNYAVNWYKDNVFIGAGTGTKMVTPTLIQSVFMAIVKDACSVKPDTAKIRMALKPVIKLIVNGFCLGDTTVGKVGNGQLTIGNTYNWQINNQNNANADSILKIVFPTTGNYRITVSTDNSLPCIGRDTTDISIIKKPKADFSFLHLKDLNNPLAFRFTDLSTNAYTWFWQFGNNGNANIQNPEHNFGDTGYMKIKLLVSNGNVCFDSIEKIIPIFDRIQFYFPNAFSPNSNGLNDDFGLNPNQYYLVKEFHLEIYNRWGEVVFKTNDVRERWLASTSSTSRKPQQGVYMFNVVVKDIFDVVQELTGAVEVLR